MAQCTSMASSNVFSRRSRCVRRRTVGSRPALPTRAHCKALVLPMYAAQIQTGHTEPAQRNAAALSPQLGCRHAQGHMPPASPLASLARLGLVVVFFLPSALGPLTSQPPQPPPPPSPPPVQTPLLLLRSASQVRLVHVAPERAGGLVPAVRRLLVGRRSLRREGRDQAARVALAEARVSQASAFASASTNQYVTECRISGGSDLGVW